MTSSLVGSEMCIRDSPKWRQGGAGRARMLPVETGKTSRRRGSGPRRQQKSCHHLRCHRRAKGKGLSLIHI
eukprot:7673188-Prorocentrum_lima.AAC.1